MAGQPPDPSYQPTGQDSGLTQGRLAWQAPASYTPPGGTGAGAGAGQAYAAPAPSYPPQDQTYTANPGQPYQDYQAYQQGYQAYGAQQPGQAQGTPPPQWQAAAGVQQAGGRAKSTTEKGFLSSLFDFSFTSMVTPKIIKVLYVLFTIWTILGALAIIVIFAVTGGLTGTVVALVLAPIFAVLSLGLYRIILEAFMVIFQMHAELKKIREQGENQP